jgi:hypothetical protein
LLDGKVTDPVAEKIFVIGRVHRRRVDRQAVGETPLAGQIARPEMGKIVAMGDRAGIEILRPVRYPVFHGASAPLSGN